MADYIGTVNLTSMFSKGGSIVATNAIWAAGDKVYETQVLASRYLTQLAFKPKVRSSLDDARFGYLLAQPSKIAAANKPNPAIQKPSVGRRMLAGLKKVFG